LRLLLGYMYAQPGKKLLMMGTEVGQWSEWSHESGLEWNLVRYDRHQKLQRWVADLNRLYRSEPALHQGDCMDQGFEWIDANDADNSVLSFLRKSVPQAGHPHPNPLPQGEGEILVVCNFTPVPRRDYRVGVPRGGFWRELINSDSEAYGGSGWGNLGGVEAEAVPFHGRPYSLNVTAPPLSAVLLKAEG